jgi:DNA-binding NarL/FixJ family response regulator
MTEGARNEEMNSFLELTQANSIRVYLLIERRLSREALARFFRRSPDLLIVGQSGQPEGACQEIPESRCDVLVMDTFNQQWLSKFLECQSWPRSAPQTLLLGMDNDVDQFLAAVRLGIAGYLLNDASAADIVAATRAVARGEAQCPPQLCLKLFQHVARTHAPVRTECMFTQCGITLRQQKLVNLVAKGLTNKEIASQLNLSEFTVKNHLHRIMRRLRAANRREVVDIVRALERKTLQSGSRG